MVVVAREEVPETVIPLVEVATRLDPLSVQKLVTLTRQSTPLIEKQLAVEVISLGHESASSWHDELMRMAAVLQEAGEGAEPVVTMDEDERDELTNTCIEGY